MSAVADVLYGAADLIERDGWVQGRSRSMSGRRRCAWAAIVDASVNSDGILRTATAAAGTVEEAGTVEDLVGATLLSSWNDRPGRTQAEVVAALRAAAERAS